jgi:ribosomal protein S18 acetylase RimI-like enzyme
MSLAIRRAMRADLPSLVPLAVALVKQHHAYDSLRFALFERLDEGYAWFLGRELDDDDAVVLAAVSDDGRIVGYAYGRIEERSYEALLEKHGALHDIFVEEPSRGAGVAQLLVERMLDELRAKGAPRVVLAAADKNERAQKLFARLGFRRTMVEMTRELP